MKGGRGAVYGDQDPNAFFAPQRPAHKDRPECMLYNAARNRPEASFASGACSQSPDHGQIVISRLAGYHCGRRPSVGFAANVYCVCGDGGYKC